MTSVRVSGGDTLLGMAIAAYVRALLPGASVDHDAGEAGDGIRIDLDDTGRWIFLGASHGREGAAAEALSDGACAVTTLDSAPAEFGLALKALIEGGPGFVPIHMARWMAGEALGRNQPAASSERAPARPALTAREREILQRVARGCTNGEIAAELMISTNTVRTHLHALSVKLESTSRTRMLARARALAIPEAFDFAARVAVRDQRASA